MSYQACNWAVAQQIVTDSPARHILLCMANYASVTGEDVWMSAARLSRETGLSIRTVRYKLDLLQEAGLITPGDDRILAIKFPRADQRPLIFNLNLKMTGLQELHPVGDERPAAHDTNDLQLRTERPAGAAPNTGITNHIDQPVPPKPPKGGRIAKPVPAVGEEKYSPEFEEFWQAWPKAKGGTKALAYKSWLKLKLDDPDQQQARTLLAYDVSQRSQYHRQWLDGFVPHMATYLNQRQWTAPIDHSTGPRNNGRASTTYERIMAASDENRAALSEDLDELRSRQFGH